jgi:DNA invertase Pin-like site-specific DNA recombinase
MRAAIYARVSTTNGQQSPEMQLLELREFVTRRGWTVAGEYVDRASGAKDNRPALAQMMADAAQRKVDVILVWKLDRFGRSLRHLVNALAELESRGVAFVSLHDNLDLGTPAGRLMFQIIAAMAEFERSLIQERVKAGLRNARAKGKRLGRPRKRLDGGAIARLRGEGNTWDQIAGRIGVGRSTLVRLGYKGREGAEISP